MSKRLVPRTKVKPTGVKILLWGIVVLILMNLLARFNIIDLTALQTDIITLLAIFFVATEIGVMQAIARRKKLDALSIFGAVVIALALLGLIAGWLGFSLGFLEAAQGFVALALLVFVVIEIFR